MAHNAQHRNWCGAASACMAVPALLYAVFFVCHRYILRTGQPVLVRHTRLSQVPGQVAVAGGDNPVWYAHLSGDLGSSLVAREVLDDQVYFKHGITLPCDRPLLVLDIGANIGLFALAVTRDFSKAVVVGAEPVDELCELAARNTAAARGPGGRGRRVVVVPMAVCEAARDVAATLVVNSFMSAGTSMYEEIVRPYVQSSICAQLRAVLLDNGRAGNIPEAVAMCVGWSFSVPVLREVVAVLLTPVLALIAIYALSASRLRRSVRASVGTLQDLLERAAQQCRGSVMLGDRQLADFVSSRTSDIDLVKIDVEGAELDVLRGIDEAHWARILQMVVEVHDIQSRVSVVCEMLHDRGFDHVVVDQDDWTSHELLRIRSVYARRASTA